jgi:hypothetical protein
MKGSHVPVTLHVPVNGTSQKAGNSGAQCVVHTAAGLQQGASLQSGGSEHAGPVVVVVLIVEVVVVEVGRAMHAPTSSMHTEPGQHPAVSGPFEQGCPAGTQASHESIGPGPLTHVFMGSQQPTPRS